jgi:DNA-binding NarL/FixJ family response regulator
MRRENEHTKPDISFNSLSRQYYLTDLEKKGCSILIVMPEGPESNGIFEILKGLNFGRVSRTQSHAKALLRVQDELFTHVILDSRPTDMTPTDCIKSLLRKDEDIKCIPASYQPALDDVFSMLMAGASGFVVFPFSINTLEDMITWSIKGYKIPRELLVAKNRNRALVAIALNRLDQLADTIKDGPNYRLSKSSLADNTVRFKIAGELLKVFPEGGIDSILEELTEFSIERSKVFNTRLGKIREKIDKSREKKTKILVASPKK